MIGVVIKAGERETAEEFFELFKTPWEFARPGRTYAAVVSTAGRPEWLHCPALVAYGADGEGAGDDSAVLVQQMAGAPAAEWGRGTLPVFGRAAFFPRRHSLLRHDGLALDCRHEVPGTVIWRVGYGLFEEVARLLGEGQPPALAPAPTLDLHVSILRTILKACGVAFVEIPPRPAGYDFTCCLTHDVDFAGIRRHRFDSTLAGFAARASLGSLSGLVRGRRSVAEVARNSAALLSLPLVMLGVLPDLWQPIEDYRKADRGHPSTFFFVPFRDRPGVDTDGAVAAGREVRYQASEVAQDVARLAARGQEVAVHGIDAWRDADAARAELAEVVPLAGRDGLGVRMHWLYFDAGSPRRLDAAGYDYDSTCGYNDAVGYHAGTSQVFRPPGSNRLLELPLAIMDTALFFPGRMNLSPREALDRCRLLIAHAREAGGTLVVNWHDRSLAPERLWGRAYDDLLDELEGSHAWFATGREAVEWFRWRRAIAFDADRQTVTVRAASLAPGLPQGLAAVRRPSPAGDGERSLEGNAVLRVSL
jgi:hypothetical protein